VYVKTESDMHCLGSSSLVAQLQIAFLRSLVACDNYSSNDIFFLFICAMLLLLGHFGLNLL
jgi:hypothetical protein